MHLAKATLPSTKNLPSAALGKEPPVKNPSAKNSLPSVFYRALCKVFVECNLGTRQRKVIVTAPVALAHALPSAMSEALGKDFLIFFSKFLCRVPYRGGTRQSFFLIISLPRALLGRRSTNIFYFFRNFFAECPGPGTRQSWEFCQGQGTRQRG